MGAQEQPSRRPSCHAHWRQSSLKEPNGQRTPAYCSQLTVEDVIEQYSRYHQVSTDQAREAVFEQAPALRDRELGPIRVRLVANGFGPSVTHVVLFLIDLGLDIGCIEISARQDGEHRAVLTARQLLPPPAAEDYLVKRRRRELEEEEREATTRRRNSVTVLSEAGTIAVDQDVPMNLQAFTPEQRAAIEDQIRAAEDFGIARWTGLGIKQALRWKHDGALYSCSGLIWKILNDLGFNPGSIPGPDYWLAPSGRALYVESCRIEDELRARAADVPPQ